MKAIAIGIVEVNPLVEIGQLLWCVHLHLFFPSISLTTNKELSPYTHFYMGLYLLLIVIIGIIFNNITFLVKIDHDDGTVKHILSHLVAE